MGYYGLAHVRVADTVAVARHHTKHTTNQRPHHAGTPLEKRIKPSVRQEHAETALRAGTHLCTPMLTSGAACTCPPCTTCTWSRCAAWPHCTGPVALTSHRERAGRHRGCALTACINKGTLTPPPEPPKPRLPCLVTAVGPTNRGHVRSRWRSGTAARSLPGLAGKSAGKHQNNNVVVLRGNPVTPNKVVPQPHHVLKHTRLSPHCSKKGKTQRDKKRTLTAPPDNAITKTVTPPTKTRPFDEVFINRNLATHRSDPSRPELIECGRSGFGGNPWGVTDEQTARDVIRPFKVYVLGESPATEITLNHNSNAVERNHGMVHHHRDWENRPAPYFSKWLQDLICKCADGKSLDLQCPFPACQTEPELCHTSVWAKMIRGGAKTQAGRATRASTPPRGTAASSSRAPPLKR